MMLDSVQAPLSGTVQLARTALFEFKALTGDKILYRIRREDLARSRTRSNQASDINGSTACFVIDQLALTGMNSDLSAQSERE